MWKQLIVLKDHADFLAQRLLCLLIRINTLPVFFFQQIRVIDQDFPAVSGFQITETAQQRSLAASAQSHQNNDFLLPYIQIYVAKNLVVLKRFA